MSAPMDQEAVLLLVAHGSPDPRHQSALEQLLDGVRKHTHWPVHLCFLEHNAPAVSAVVRELQLGARVYLVPVLLTKAFHRLVDIPRIHDDLVAAGHRVTLVDAIGYQPQIVDAVIESAGIQAPLLDEAPGREIIAALTGSRRQDALDELSAAWGSAHWRSSTWRVVALSDLGGVSAAIDRARARGLEPVVVGVAMAPGILQDRIVDQATQAGVSCIETSLAQTKTLAHLICRLCDL